MRTTMTSCGKALSGRARPTMAVLMTTTVATLLVLFAFSQQPALAAVSPGQAWSWGTNEEGELGLGHDQFEVKSPARISGFKDVVDVGGGEAHSTWLKSDGTVWASGDISFGQLGDGSTNRIRYSPAQVSGLTNVVDVDNGGRHSLAVKGDGTVWAWGDNYQGRLGDGTLTDRPTPVQVRGLTGVTYLEGGGWSSYAISRETDTTKPTVKSSAPLANATGVSPGANVTATFSEKMDKATVTRSTFKLFRVTASGTTQVTNVAVSLGSDGLKATLNPFGTSTTKLTKNAKYKATVTTGAKDLAGNALDQNPSVSGNQPKNWTFTVRR